MATATSNLKSFMPIPPKVEEGKVTLELSGPESRTLILILDKVAGDGANSARVYAEEIRNALRLVRVENPLYTRLNYEKYADGFIQLKESSKMLVEIVP